MKIVIILILSCIAINHCFSQSQWQIKIGGTNYYNANSIKRTLDYGYILAGETFLWNSNSYSLFIVKLNSISTLQWTRTIGGPGYNKANSIIQTSDHGFAVAGFTAFGAGNEDMYIVKLDSNGSFQWNKAIGGTGDDYVKAVIQTTDGGYVLVGHTLSFGLGIYIVKLDATGTIQWTKTMGIGSADIGNSIIQTKNNGYVIAGSTGSYGTGSPHMYIIKLDSNWIIEWSRTVGGSSGEYAYSIIQTVDSGYVAAGDTFFGAGYFDMYLAKLSSSGSLQWTRTIGGNRNDVAYSIIQTLDSGVIAAGRTESFGAGDPGDMYIVKLNSNGILEWSKSIGGPNGETAYSIVQSSDSGYVITGNTYSFGAYVYDLYTVKIDKNGNSCGNSSSLTSISGSGGILGIPNSSITFPASTITTPTPVISSDGTHTTLCLVGSHRNSNEIPKAFELEQNYPNPFNPTTKIKFAVPSNVKGETSNVKIIVYDILGKEVITLVNEQLQPGTYEVEFDGSKYSSGVYFYKLSAESGLGESTKTKKMLLVK